MLSDGSVGFFMYFHLVCSPESFASASGGRFTRKFFCQATDVMVLNDHEFVLNSASPTFAFPSCPFHMGILLPLRKRLRGSFWDTHGYEKPNSKSCANANFVYW